MDVEQVGAFFVFHDAEAALDGVADGGLVGGVGGFHAEAFGQLDRVDVVQHDATVLAGVLHLGAGVGPGVGDDTVSAVVGDDVHDRHAVAGRRPQAVVGVVQGTVADQADHGLVGRAQLGADGRADAVALGAAGGPDVLVVAGVAGVVENVLGDGELLYGNQAAAASLQRSVQSVAEDDGTDSAVLRRDVLRIGPQPRPQGRHLLAGPGAAAGHIIGGGVGGFQQALGGALLVGQHGQVQAGDVLQVFGVGADGDGAPGVEEGGVVAGVAGAIMGDADAQDEVGVDVAGLFQAAAAGVERVLDGESAGVAHHGDAEPLGKGGNLGDGAALPHAVADVHHGTVGVAEGAGDGFDVGIRGIAGAELGQAAVDDVGGVLLWPQQAVIDGQMHRADGRRHGDAQGALHGGGQALRLDDRPVGLHHGGGDGGGAGVVADVEADFAGEAASVAGEGDDDHRQAAGPDIDELAHGLGQAGAQVDDHNAGGEVSLSVARRPWR